MKRHFIVFCEGSQAGIFDKRPSSRKDNFTIVELSNITLLATLLCLTELLFFCHDTGNMMYVLKHTSPYNGML